MGIFGKMFGSTRSDKDSIKILLNTLPYARFKCILAIIQKIEEIAETEWTTAGDRIILEKNSINCDELITSINMYQVLTILPKYISDDKKLDFVFKEIAFQNKEQNGNKIYNKFIEICKNREAMEEPLCCKDYLVKLKLKVVATLTEGTSLEKNKKIPDNDYKMLNSSISATINTNIFWLKLNTTYILRAAYEKEYSTIPTNAVINEMLDLVDKDKRISSDDLN